MSTLTEDYAAHDEWQLSQVISHLEEAQLSELDITELEQARDRLNSLLARLRRRAA